MLDVFLETSSLCGPGSCALGLRGERVEGRLPGPPPERLCSPQLPTWLQARWSAGLALRIPALGQAWTDLEGKEDSTNTGVTMTSSPRDSGDAWPENGHLQETQVSKCDCE